MAPGILAVAILLMVATYGLFGQSDRRPAFQSVSIKQNTSNWSERFKHPMGMRNNASLMLLIQFAYASHENPMAGHSLPLPVSQVTGGPAWLNAEGYDIKVEPGANADPKQVWLMWQRLLADRFKLRLHRETRQLPIYILTTANNGLKLPAPPKDVGCVSFPPGTQPRHVPGRVDCGYISGPFGDSDRLRITGNRVRISDFIRELATVLDRQVLDGTGFAGEFDLDLSFAADQSLSGSPGFGPGEPGDYKLSTDRHLPNIFTALEEQLGLKLVPSEGPVEVLVIDHAERPTAN
jgi:uncharacterized protein (TIGR03435 family)